MFDYDAVGNDDFMGIVRVPGYALFNLGVSEHIFWFRLGDSKKKKVRASIRLWKSTSEQYSRGKRRIPTLSSGLLCVLLLKAVNYQPKTI